jgi:hypothetical protein
MTRDSSKRQRGSSLAHATAGTTYAMPYKEAHEPVSPPELRLVLNHSHSACAQLIDLRVEEVRPLQGFEFGLWGFSNSGCERRAGLSSRVLWNGCANGVGCSRQQKRRRHDRVVSLTRHQAVSYLIPGSVGAAEHTYDCSACLKAVHVLC